MEEKTQVSTEEKIQVSKSSDTSYDVQFQIPPDEVESKMDSFLKEIKKNVEMKGFRKGTVPMGMLRQKFAEKCRVFVSQSLLQEYYPKLLSDHNLSPIGNPDVKEEHKNDVYIGTFGSDNSYSIGMTLEVLPSIDPVGYKDLELDFPVIDEDKLYDDKLLGCREQFAERNEVEDRGANLNDSVVIDFKGSLDGELFKGGSAEDHLIDKLGHGSLIPGFEDQLVGVKVGQSKDVIVTFPDNYHAEHLRGKEAKFEVLVKSVVERKLADVDDDLAMMVGFDDVLDMEKGLKEQAKKEAELRLRNILDGQVSQKIVEMNDFEVPKTLLTDEQTRIMQNLNVKENLPENVVQEVKKHAKNNIKRALILNAIYEKEEDVEITPDEVNEALEKQAEASGKSKDEVVTILQNTKQMDPFVETLRSSKVMDFIIGASKKKEQ